MPCGALFSGAGQSMVNEADRKRKSEYDRAYRIKNADRIREQKRIQAKEWWSKPENKKKKLAQTRTYYRKDPESYRAYTREWRKRNPDYGREYRLASQYGLTPSEYNAILEKQGGVCAICSSVPNGHPLCVDHEHGTKRIRGLLCPSCNTFVGRFEHADMESVLRYLRGNKDVP